MEWPKEPEYVGYRFTPTGQHKGRRLRLRVTPKDITGKEGVFWPVLERVGTFQCQFVVKKPHTIGSFFAKRYVRVDFIAVIPLHLS